MNNPLQSYDFSQMALSPTHLLFDDLIFSNKIPISFFSYQILNSHLITDEHL